MHLNLLCEQRHLKVVSKWTKPLSGSSLIPFYPTRSWRHQHKLSSKNLKDSVLKAVCFRNQIRFPAPASSKTSSSFWGPKNHDWMGRTVTNPAERMQWSSYHSFLKGGESKWRGVLRFQNKSKWRAWWGVYAAAPKCRCWCSCSATAGIQERISTLVVVEKKKNNINNYHHYPIAIYKGQQLSKTNQDE